MTAPTKFQIIREAMGLNKTELAKLMGVNRATVSRWEKGGATVVAMLAIGYLLEIRVKRWRNE